MSGGHSKEVGSPRSEEARIRQAGEDHPIADGIATAILRLPNVEIAVGINISSPGDEA